MPRCNPRRQSQNTLLPPARISFSASAQNDVLFAISAPTCSTYSCQLFSISSLNSCGSVLSRSPCWRFSGWYTTRSDTSARARRRAFCFGSCTMNGFTGRSGPVMRWPGGALGAALGAGGAAAGAAGRAGGVAAGARTGAVGDAGGRSVGVGGAAAGAAGGATGRGGAAGGAGARGGVPGATTGPEKRGMPGGRGGTGTDGGGGGGAGARGAARAGAGGGGADGDAGAALAGAAGARGGAAAAEGAPAVTAPAALTANTLLHTAQRARTPPGGTLPGSTRYTVSHDGQVTFISRAPRSHRAPDRAGGPPRTPIPAASWHSSSFRSRARSPAPGARSAGAGSSRSRSRASSAARGAVARAGPSRNSSPPAGPARCTGTVSACRTPRAPRRTPRGCRRTG